MFSASTLPGVFLTLGLLLVGCAPAEEAPYVLDGPPVPRDSAPRYDLLASHPFADRWAEVERIEMGRYAARPHLTRGWSYPEGPGDEEIPDDALLWADALEAEVTFLLRERSERRLITRLRALQVGRDRSPVVLSLNGDELATFEVGRDARRIEVELPVASQRVGLNRLLFTGATLARLHHVNEGSKDVRRLSFAVGPLVFRSEDRAAQRSRAAEGLVPGGARPAPWSPQAIEQVSGALLRHHLRVPPDGELRARVVFTSRADRSCERAVFRVFLTPDGGDERLLFEQSATYRSTPVQLRASLAEWAGQVVRLELRVEADGASETVSAAVAGGWIAAGVWGGEVQREIRAEESEGLRRAREGLVRAPVVAILLDACNPDFLSTYGGRPDGTPHIDRLAAEGVTFEAAHAQASYTISSIASTLTSRTVWEHGAWSESTRLSTGVDTWPERFRQAGYRTVGIVHTPNGSSIYGYERGFEIYEELFKGAGRKRPRAEDVLPAIDRALADDGRPLFLWMHLIEPHAPYHPPAPWAGRLDPDYAGELTGDSDHLWDIRRGNIVPSARDMQHLRAEYEEGLAYVDDVVGRIRERLTQAGLFEEAIVLLFSDHGEGFMEHEGKIFAGQGHGSTTYQEMTRIPLIVRLPAGLGPSGARRSQTVANLDLLATAADLAGVGPMTGGVGHSFAALLFDDAARARELVLSHASSGNTARFLPTAVAAWSGSTKYVHVTGGPSLLFDLDRDPGELHDLSAEREVLAGWMRERLRVEVGVDLDRAEPLEASGGETTIDEHALEMLRALGYVR